MPHAVDDVLARLAAWRDRGAADVDPVQWCFIEALARRTATAQAPARTLLLARLEQLLAAHVQRLGATVPTAAPVPGPGPLAALLGHIAAHAEPGAAGALPELKSLRRFRRTWARLSAEQRLAQSHARLPDNAGPLHSQRLVHRALNAMRQLSPAYLEHFIAHVDALLWLDQVHGGDVWTKQDVLLAAGPPGDEAKRRRTRRR